MVFEVRHIDDGIAVDCGCRPHDRTRAEGLAEIARDRENVDRRMVIEVTERVDCGHGEASPRGRVRSRPRRDAGNQDMRHLGEGPAKAGYHVDARLKPGTTLTRVTLTRGTSNLESRF